MMQQLIKQYRIKLIAIGNGTASRETDIFIGDIIKNLETKPIKVMVNESGASIYSATSLYPTWDGGDVQDGLYWYVIHKNGEQVRTGTLLYQQ